MKCNENFITIYCVYAKKKKWNEFYMSSKRWVVDFIIFFCILLYYMAHAIFAMTIWKFTVHWILQVASQCIKYVLSKLCRYNTWMKLTIKLQTLDTHFSIYVNQYRRFIFNNKLLLFALFNLIIFCITAKFLSLKFCGNH